MAIVRESLVSKTAANVSTAAVTGVSVAGADNTRLLLVTSSSRDYWITGINLDGDSTDWVRLDRKSNTAARVEIWYRLNPPTGTNKTVNITYGGATRYVASVACFSGVDTTDPFRDQTQSGGLPHSVVWPAPGAADTTALTAPVVVATDSNDYAFGTCSGVSGSSTAMITDVPSAEWYNTVTGGTATARMWGGSAWQPGGSASVARTVAASAGDVDCYDATFNLTDLGFYPDWTGYTKSEDGAHFPNITVAKDATILYAFARLTPHITSTTTGGSTIHGEAADNPANFAADNVTTYNERVRTDASVVWSIPAITATITHQSPDISTIIEEITTRAGWASGQAMVLFFLATKLANKAFKSYDTSTTLAPQLVVIYSTGAPANLTLRWSRPSSIYAAAIGCALKASTAGSTAVISTGIANVEKLILMPVTGGPRLEMLDSFVLQQGVDIEAVLPLDTTGVTDVEMLVPIPTTAISNLEALARASRSGLTGLERLLPVSRTQAVTLESLMALAQTKGLNVEMLLALSAMGTLNLEALGAVTLVGVSQTGIANIEMVGTIQTTALTNLERLAVVARTLGVNLEDILPISQTAIPNLEMLLRVVPATGTLNVEALSRFATSGILTLERLSKAFGQRTTNIEALLPLSSTGIINLERLGELLVATWLPVGALEYDEDEDQPIVMAKVNPADYVGAVWRLHIVLWTDDTLKPAKARVSYSQDSGATWTEIAGSECSTTSTLPTLVSSAPFAFPTGDSWIRTEVSGNTGAGTDIGVGAWVYVGRPS